MSRPAYYILTYDGTPVGDRVIEFHSDPVLDRAPKIIPRLWSSEQCVDARYPSRHWEHRFTITLISSTPADLYLRYAAMEAQLRDGVGAEVIIEDADDNQLIDLKFCYYTGQSWVNPDSKLKTTAGHVEVSFISMFGPEAVS